MIGYRSSDTVETSAFVQVNEMDENLARSRKKTSFQSQLFNIKSSPAVNERPNELQVYNQKANSLAHSLAAQNAHSLTAPTVVISSPVTSRPVSLLRNNDGLEMPNGQSSGYGRWYFRKYFGIQSMHPLQKCNW